MDRNEYLNLGTKSNDTGGFVQLEEMAKNYAKIPIKKPERETGFYNINRSDPKSALGQMELNVTHGRPSEPSHKINNVLRHDYLRRSMVDRIERKNMISNYK